MKKFIAIIIVIILLFSLCSCNKGKNSHIYERDGDLIYLGYFPKSLKSKEVTLSYDTNTEGYYTGSDGELYIKQTASIDNSGGYTYADGSNLIDGQVYYFKLEKIKWKIISEQNDVALLLSEDIIYSAAFTENSSSNYLSNNYKESSIRNWLNNDFYKKAFSYEEKLIIKKTYVNNAAETTVSGARQYCCADTNDNVFLLSYSDVINENYGFLNTENNDKNRIKNTTDYAVACGAGLKFNTYATAGFWLLRSPGDLSNYSVRAIYYDGDCDGNYSAYNSRAGIVPAIQIYL